MLYNSDTGLAGGARQQLTQADAAGAVESGDRFGAALSGPFLHESDALEDLGIGARGERVGGAAGAGAVSVLFSTGPDGLGSAGRQFLLPGHRRPGRRRRTRRRLPRRRPRLTPRTRLRLLGRPPARLEAQEVEGTIQVRA